MNHVTDTVYSFLAAHYPNCVTDAVSHVPQVGLLATLLIAFCNVRRLVVTVPYYFYSSILEGLSVFIYL